MKEVTFGGRTPALTVTLTGIIDSGNADEFYEEVAAEYRKAPADLVFRCVGLEFIDSTTLGTFVKLMKVAEAEGHKVRLEGLRPSIRKLFVICALDTIMEIPE